MNDKSYECGQKYVMHYFYFFYFQSPAAVQYVSKHSKGQIAVVENEEQLNKFLSIRSDLPDLKGNIILVIFKEI